MKGLRFARTTAPAIALATLLGLAADSFAAPPAVPEIPKGAKLEYSFNLIGVPGDYAGGCGEGHRIFVNRDAHHDHILIVNHDEFHVEQCNGTDETAVLHVDTEAVLDAECLVYARILGKPGGRLQVCAELVTDHDHLLCELGTIDLIRASGQSKFQLQPASLFDTTLGDVIWSVDTNADYRIAQFRVYCTPE